MNEKKEMVFKKKFDQKAAAEGGKVVKKGEDVDEKIASDDDAQSSLAGLTEQEKALIKTQTDAPNEKVGYFSLFRYAGKKDLLIMSVASFASIVAGACLPLTMVSSTPVSTLFGWGEQNKE